MAPPLKQPSSAPSSSGKVSVRSVAVWGGLVVCGLLARGWILRQPVPSQPVPAAIVEAKPAAAPLPEPPPETLARNLDAQEVFRRALWRRPQEGDVIQNAERREWSDAEGVTRWEWFLVVTPGPVLDAWLQTNPFSLQKVERPREGGPVSSGGAPEWFPKEFPEKEIFQSNVGNFLLVRDAANGRIFLADSGGGLARSVAQ